MKKQCIIYTIMMVLIAISAFYIGMNIRGVDKPNRDMNLEANNIR